MRTRGKRPYLSSDRRRDELLGVAAALVVGGGWGALTMKGLATEARVSRQLVYQHFADLPELLVAVTRRLFQSARDATEAVVAHGRDGDVADVARRSFEIYLDLPRDQRRVLRAITAEPEIESPELRRVRRHVRDQLIDLWTPGVRRRTGLPRTKARALAWTMTSAAWGLGDLVDDGEIALPHARDLLARVAARVLEPAVAQSARPAGRRTPQPRAVARAQRRKASDEALSPARHDAVVLHPQDDRLPRVQGHPVPAAPLLRHQSGGARRGLPRRRPRDADPRR